MLRDRWTKESSHEIIIDCGKKMPEISVEVN